MTAFPAIAQIQAGSGLRGNGAPGATPEGEKKAPPPPPALPGAQSRAGNAIAAEKPLSEMSPTDALFDSVERGNLADAKDAVARGADLSARNALGQTPLETSVDLAHNDVTFYLLSMRGVDDGAHRGPPRARPAVTTTREAAATRARSKRLPTEDRPPADDVEDAVPRTLKPTGQGRYVATDGGRAVPQAGFLGFGGGFGGSGR